MSGSSENEEKRLEEEYARILGELHSETRTGMEPGGGAGGAGAAPVRRIQWANETNEGRIAGLMSPVTATRYTPNGTKANLHKEMYNPKYTQAAALYKMIMTTKLPDLQNNNRILENTIANQDKALAEEAPQIPPGENSRRSRLVETRRQMIELSSHILGITGQLKKIYERMAYLYGKFSSQVEPDEDMGAGGAGGAGGAAAAAAAGEYIPEAAIIAEIQALEKDELTIKAEFEKLKGLYEILKQIIHLRKVRGGYKKRPTRRIKKTRRSKARR
jgi:hypothetical protein